MKEEFKILYEDEHIVALDKPSGIMVHPDGRSDEKTLAHWFIEKYPDAKDVGEPARSDKGEELLRAGVVHRLDRDTSGVILFAKTNEGFTCLKEQFQTQAIHKTYVAFVYGTMKENDGRIERSIGRSAKDFRLRSAQRGARGKLREAVTGYRVLKRGVRHTYVELRPETGRTHQIRVHLKAVNHPVVCDELYAPKMPCELSFSRLALHAKSIEFEDISGEKRTVEAPLPKDFEKALGSLRER